MMFSRQNKGNINKILRKYNNAYILCQLFWFIKKYWKFDWQVTTLNTLRLVMKILKTEKHKIINVI